METTIVPAARQRVPYLDYLRLMAAFGVIMIHASAQNWSAVPLLSWERQVFSWYNYAANWPVEIFVMISGALFLDEERPLSVKKLYTRYIFRLMIAYLFWSAVYALVGLLEGSSIQEAWNALWTGHFHMWYIRWAVKAYIAVPIIRQICRSKRVTEYLLAVLAAVTIFFPTLLSWVQHFLPGLLAQTMESWISIRVLGASGIYLFYFVCGLYLHKYDLKDRWQRLLPVLAILGILFRGLVSSWWLYSQGTDAVPVKFYLTDLPVPVSIFLLTKKHLSGARPAQGVQKFLTQSAQCAFGIYIIHMLVLDKLDDWLGWNTLCLPAVVSVPAVALSGMAISLAIVWLLRKVPFFRKYVL